MSLQAKKKAEYSQKKNRGTEQRQRKDEEKKNINAHFYKFPKWSSQINDEHEQERDTQEKAHAALGEYYLWKPLFIEILLRD